MGDREAAIQAAISDIDAGVFLSQRAAAKARTSSYNGYSKKKHELFLPPTHAHEKWRTESSG
ncbi:hypothetical protein A1F96_02129 [Pyrenophora tritici-repentis]|nr:hypothetical protein A1F96_02129 [Pyrenophora tritici-repentis]